MHRERQRTQARIGANIRCRLVAANMLFARRQRENKAALAIGIDSFAAQTPGHLAQKLFARGKQADIRPAEIQTIAQRLAFADDNIGTHCAGRFQNTQRHCLSDNDNQQGATCVHGLGDFGIIVHRTKKVRVLHNDA